MTNELIRINTESKIITKSVIDTAMLRNIKLLLISIIFVLLITKVTLGIDAPFMNSILNVSGSQPNSSSINGLQLTINESLNYTSNGVGGLVIDVSDKSKQGVDYSSEYDLWSSYSLTENSISARSKYFGELRFPIYYQPQYNGYYVFELVNKNTRNTESILKYNYNISDSVSQPGTISSANPNNTLNKYDNDSIPKENNTVLKHVNTSSSCGDFNISLNKEIYGINEEVLILFTSPTESKISPELMLQNNYTSYKFIGDLQNIVFVPKIEGLYSIIMSCQGKTIEEINFTVMNQVDLSIENTSSNILTNISSGVLLNPPITANERTYPIRSGNVSLVSITIKDSKGKKLSTYAKAYNVTKLKNLRTINILSNGKLSGTSTDIISSNNNGSTDNRTDNNSEIVEYLDLNLSDVPGLQNASMTLNEVTLANFNTTSLLIEQVIDPNISKEHGTVMNSYAMDLSDINFTKGEFTKTAVGRQLLKCTDWDFSKQECFGDWQKVMDIIPGQDYTIEINSSDPGYAEVSLNVITLQSYPIVGGNWTVAFNTTGVADLNIRAFSPTTWSNVDRNTDLKFLEIRCDDNILPYEWINNSVFIANYSCNGISYETSKVLTRGKHTIEFTFGNDTKYAYNNASDPWWNYSWLKRKQLNITNLNNTDPLPKDFSINITLDTSVANDFSQMEMI